MKREGRQHGVVRIYGQLPSFRHQKTVKMVDPVLATGMFTKVSNKPTNQSKFTGKCRKPRCNGCRIHPACKSKDKAKGTMRLRSIDAENQLTKYPAGTSATGVLAYLADQGSYNYGYDEDEYDYDGTVDENYNYGHHYDQYHDDNDDSDHDIDLRVGFGIGIVASVAAEERVDDDDEVDDDDDDDTMSFCDVGLCWGHGDGDDEYGDDGWYLVGGQML